MFWSLRLHTCPLSLVAVLFPVLKSDLCFEKRCLKVFPVKPVYVSTAQLSCLLTVALYTTEFVVHIPGVGHSLLNLAWQLHFCSLKLLFSLLRIFLLCMPFNAMFEIRYAFVTDLHSVTINDFAKVVVAWEIFLDDC